MFYPDSTIKELQKIFDHVAKHLITQNRRSLDDMSGTCAYRGGKGTSCAIGCLINDEYYSVKLEGKVVYNVDILQAVMKSGFGTEINTVLLPNFLYRLQRIHDDDEVAKWPKLLRLVAVYYSLNSDVLGSVSNV